MNKTKGCLIANFATVPYWFITLAIAIVMFLVVEVEKRLTRPLRKTA
nr:hypothetical protein [Raoultella ornithinolytica]